MSSTPFAKSLINGIVVALFVDSMTLLLFVSGPIINPNPGNVTEYWLMLGTTFALTNMWFVFVFLFYLNRVASTNVGLERNRKTVWAIMLTFFVFSALNLLGCVITAVWRVYEYSKCSGLEDEHPCNQNPSYRISFVQLICNAILVVTSIIQTFISGYLALVNLRTSGVSVRRLFFDFFTHQWKKNATLNIKKKISVF
jgi:hypothetical protein